MNYDYVIQLAHRLDAGDSVTVAELNEALVRAGEVPIPTGMSKRQAFRELCDMTGLSAREMNKFLEDHGRPPFEPTSLYRLYDDNFRLLYIGIAGNPGRRFQQHAKEKEWWGDVVHVRLQHFDTRSAAAQAEIKAIQEEWPPMNVRHRKESR